MTKKSLTTIFTIIGILLATIQSHAGTFTAFGPKTYTREKGKPDEVIETFYLRSISGDYKLIVENGIYVEIEEDNEDEKDKEKKGKKTRVSAADVEVNGEDVVEEDDFKKRVVRVERTVYLRHGGNTMGLEIEGDPGAYITVWIEGTDNTPPDVTIASPANNIYLNTPSIVVNGRATDSISWVDTVKVNGTVAQLTGESYSAAIPLTEGANRVVATAFDAAGNKGSSSVTLFLDTIPPRITLDLPTITNNPKLTITGAIQDASPVDALTINGTPLSLADNRFTADATLVEGSNTITVSARDLAIPAAIAGVLGLKTQSSPLLRVS